MKLVVASIAALLVGCFLGAALAYVEVGRVAEGFAPPPREGEKLVDSSVGPQATTPAVPEATVDSELFDFGVMQRGSRQSHDFIFTNTGGQPLRLEVGKTSCKCTLGDVSDRPMMPGESSPVRLEWTARSLPGDFRQTATVHTNDPRRPSIDLTVEGLVTENTSLKPKEFLLGRVAADEVATATVYLASYDEDAPPLEASASVDEAAPNAEKLKFTVEPVAAEDLPMEQATSGVKITVEAGPGLPLGNLAQWVNVTTNREAEEGGSGATIQVPLMAIVEGDVSIHGAGWSKEKGLLNLGKIASREGDEAKLLLSFKGDHAEDLRAEVLSLDPEWLGVELGEPKRVREGVHHQKMTIRIPPGQKGVVRSGPGAENGGVGDGDGRIRLSLNHPSTSEVDVRVRFVIAD